ncbi:type II toxin-antitoxin system RelE/ParE family toxin [Dasania marina]|uniref:type II toxin-antitoxin system RelE family toxin n=1 Tax=Dasania marina TaxID=471499 RepID=UPI0030D8FC4A
MSYKLLFKQQALKEWQALDSTIKTQFKKKLVERLQNPHVEPSRLSGLKNCYKIKLRSAGYRLVYEVRDSEIVVIVIAVGKRERNAVYKSAAKRI